MYVYDVCERSKKVNACSKRRIIGIMSRNVGSRSSNVGGVKM